MRPIYRFALICTFLPLALEAQDPVSLAMHTTVRPDTLAVRRGFGWSVFSRQYYCVSNWNATGFSLSYRSGSGESSAIICRDGISGFSWYHLYLSHYQRFNKISGTLQLRFSLIGLHDRAPVFRPGGNIRFNWLVGQSGILQVNIYDFTGWILPGPAITRGDPSMQFLLFHDPGRLIGLGAGFQISPSLFGPVSALVRMNLNDRVGLTGIFDVLPFGLSVGISFRVSGYDFSGWMEHNNGLGQTPMLQISR